MATNIPPHNMREVIDGVIALIEHRAAEPREARRRRQLKAVPGPDFPTGGFIVGRQGIFNAYTTGRGSITGARQGRRSRRSKKGDKVSIVVTEIPYQVNKARLLEKIAELVREKVIEGISDLRDESDRDGMRIVIELKRGEVPEVVLNNLYKHTQLQTTFGIIMLAIVAGRPRRAAAPRHPRALHRVPARSRARRTEFELRKAEARAHILEGLKIALDHLDEVIKLIRGSKNPREAREGLMTPVQAVAGAVAGDPRHAAAAADRPRAAEDPRRAGRADEDHRAPARDPLERRAADGRRRQRAEGRPRHLFGDERRTEIIEESGEFASKI